MLRAKFDDDRWILSHIQNKFQQQIFIEVKEKKVFFKFVRTNYLRKTIFITKFQIELFIHQCPTYQKKYESVANPSLEK